MNKFLKRKKIVTVVGLFGMLLIMIFLFKGDVYALSEDTDVSGKALKTLYTDYDDLFEQNDIVSNAIRSLLMGLLSLIVRLADAASGLFEKSFGMMDFTKYGPVKAFINDWNVVWGALICVSLAWLGITLVFNSDKKPKIATNLCVAILVVTSMTWMVGKMNTLLTKDIRNEILGVEASNETIYQMLGTNIHDLLYIDKVAGIENLGKKNADGEKYADAATPLNKKMWKALDVNEVVFPDDVKDESKVIMEHYKTDIPDENGGTTALISECYDGVAWTDLLNTYYYRYSIDWLAAILEMLSLAIIYIFFTYKVVRTFYEIVFQEILAMLYSTNLTNGQKGLKVLDGIKDSYIIIMLSLVSIRLYLLATQYIAGKSWDGFSKGFILFCVALAVIDGPNIIQRLTGMDAGMSDGMQKVMSAYYASNVAAGMGKAAFGAARGVARGAKNVGKAAGSVLTPKDSSSKEKVLGGAAAMAGEANNETNNKNEQGQDVGAQFNNVNEDNDIRQEDNADINENSDSTNTSDDNRGSLDGNANADGTKKDMDDAGVAGINPEQAKADALNGMDPMRRNDEGSIPKTDRMDKELDSISNESTFNSDKPRGVLSKDSDLSFKYGNETVKSNDNFNTSGSKNTYTDRSINTKSANNTQHSYNTVQKSNTDNAAAQRIKKDALKNQ